VTKVFIVGPCAGFGPSHSKRDFEYYATKDRQMADEGSVGLMVWDGESRGLW
jgi:hypothetical protein